MATTYKIHPAIGIARVGDSQEEYFLGPEAHRRDFVPAPNGRYRDADDRIRRQAQRFRIYEYDDSSGVETPVREVRSCDASIQWEVDLANAKASQDGLNSGIPRDELIIQAADPNAKRISGANAHSEITGVIQGISVKLGDLHTDQDGRLLVLGGHGQSGAWADPGGQLGLFNSGWYDDVSDGPVRARLTLNGSGEMVEAEAAWVIVGVPGYAHPIENVVTIYDLLEDVATRLPSDPLVLPSQVSFTRDIYPVLRRAVHMQWVSDVAFGGHAVGPGNFLEPAVFQLLWDKTASGSDTVRQGVFSRLKDPAVGGSGQPGGRTMPRLNGLSLTATQYSRFDRWSNGDFDADWTGPPPEMTFSQLPVSEQPAAMDHAALAACVGGSFSPGIEAGRVISQTTTYRAPFRVSDLVAPGALTKELSVPWQADFTYCGTGWWPAGRPNVVVKPDGTQGLWVPSLTSAREMVAQWKDLGFIRKDDQTGSVQYVEGERLLGDA